MPKFKSEEHRQNWIASVRATKERKREDERETQGRPRTAAVPCVMAPVRVPAGPVVDMGIITAALTQLEEDASTLRRAIEIIERVQG